MVYKNFGKYIEVIDERNNPYVGRNKIFINWSAIGSVSPSDAENFAKELLKAIECAKKLKGRK